MADPNAFASWYRAPEKSSLNDPARDIFDEALVAFKSELSKDSTKLKWILETKQCSLPDVLDSVIDARVHYEARKGDSKIKKRLCELAGKIHHYGGIMDVMVQHHPEYVALAWGAMKLLLVGVVNQQNLISRLSGGLCQIADLLPRTELILTLYPTEDIRQSIVKIYAHILRFLLRALRWYQESKISHMIHAITRPAELRFDDLLSGISILSQNLTNQALLISHVEQRDVHTKIEQQMQVQQSMQFGIDAITKIIVQFREEMATERAFSASARIEVRQSLSEIQLSQFLGFIADVPLVDPVSVFQASTFLRNRRRVKGANKGPAFWLDKRIQDWNTVQQSSLVIVEGTRKLRFQIKDFCVDSISLLRNAKTPVIWALQTMVTQESLELGSENITTIALLKYLIAQAVKVNTRLHNEASLAPRLQAYLAANTETDWLNILISVLEGMPLVYIIIDVEILDASLAELTANFSLPVALLQVFDQLQQREVKTIIKVLLVSYGSPMFRKNMNEECHKYLVPIARKNLLKTCRRTTKRSSPRDDVSSSGKNRSTGLAHRNKLTSRLRNGV